MAYYYSTGTQQNTNASANTDTLLMDIRAIAGLRAYLQKVTVGNMSTTTPNDFQVRIRVQRTTALSSAGGAIIPTPHVSDVVAAVAVPTTLPTGGTLNAVPPVQISINGRGGSMWAAFNLDEALGMVGATAPNSQLVINSQAGGTSMPVVLTLTHSE